MKKINEEYIRGSKNIDQSSIQDGSILPLDMDFDDQSMISLKFLETPNDALNRSMASPGRQTPSKLSVIDSNGEIVTNNIIENIRKEYGSPDGRSLRAYLSDKLQKSLPKNPNLLNTETIEELTEENENSGG